MQTDSAAEQVSKPLNASLPPPKICPDWARQPLFAFQLLRRPWAQGTLTSLLCELNVEKTLPTQQTGSKKKSAGREIEIFLFCV